ncbi:NAD(P)/FAD-dependent oxidoreductase [Candidatus Hecatella orcuttiae]|jgi:phytoene dehydrogenase-like protein|uniref:phytoene desaturase family protein n=1 Tax=Candidatus Hecatella orcuttiae TaxID=1935119 RepID=UPI00286820D6|nr:NAD(P)/FAD-dependent oxidoreductase [Candidatus Hecatella orcuttiae]
MSEGHADIIVIGAGHNGLIVAGYLLKAGFSVLVVEKNPWIGGATSCREVNGFKLDWASTNHIDIQPNPLLVDDELQLKAKYGLKYIIPEVQMAGPYPDGTSMIIYRDVEKTVKQVAKLSKKDAQAYRRFAQWGIQCLETILPGMYNPPPTLGAIVSELEQSPDGQELLRAMMMSFGDIVDEWFEDDRVKALLLHYASELLLPPWENGTGSVLFIMIPIMHVYGMGCPVGGSGALAEALGRCVEAYGGKILTNSPVEKVIVENGEARGVILENGRRLRAEKAVVACLHPKPLFLNMVGEEHLEPGFVRRVKRVKQSAFSGINTTYMLNEAPRFKVEEVNEGANWEISWSLEDMMELFQDVVFRRVPPEKPCPNVVCWSKLDPSRAPPGKHSLYAISYAPYNLRDGGPSQWKEIKEEVADSVLESIREHTTNMGSGNILGRLITTPVDVEEVISSNNLLHGDLTGVRATLEQTFMFRPLISLGNYRTPVGKLYLTGECTHPGAGVAGGGRATAQVILQDFGIKFDDVLRKS